MLYRWSEHGFQWVIDRVVMITGDYPGTAQYIGRHIGLVPVDACMSGTELDAMDDTTLQERIKTTSVFVRVVPEQKLRLVNALKANGEVVAMTGDGCSGYFVHLFVKLDF